MRTTVIWQKLLWVAFAGSLSIYFGCAGEESEMLSNNAFEKRSKVAKVKESRPIAIDIQLKDNPTTAKPEIQTTDQAPAQSTFSDVLAASKTYDKTNNYMPDNQMGYGNRYSHGMGRSSYPYGDKYRTRGGRGAYPFGQGPIDGGYPYGAGIGDGAFPQGPIGAGLPFGAGIGGPVEPGLIGGALPYGPGGGYPFGGPGLIDGGFPFGGFSPFDGPFIDGPLPRPLVPFLAADYILFDDDDHKKRRCCKKHRQNHCHRHFHHCRDNRDHCCD